MGALDCRKVNKCGFMQGGIAGVGKAKLPLPLDPPSSLA
jgi:hypothetical protein